jgi:hypothetical protein
MGSILRDEEETKKGRIMKQEAGFAPSVFRPEVIEAEIFSETSISICNATNRHIPNVHILGNMFDHTSEN